MGGGRDLGTGLGVAAQLLGGFAQGRQSRNERQRLQLQQQQQAQRQNELLDIQRQQEQRQQRAETRQERTSRRQAGAARRQEVIQRLQILGAEGFNDPDVQGTLGITPEQGQNIAARRKLEEQAKLAGGFPELFQTFPGTASEFEKRFGIQLPRQPQPQLTPGSQPQPLQPTAPVQPGARTIGPEGRLLPRTEAQKEAAKEEAKLQAKLRFEKAKRQLDPKARLADQLLEQGTDQQFKDLSPRDKQNVIRGALGLKETTAASELEANIIDEGLRKNEPIEEIGRKISLLKKPAVQIQLPPGRPSAGERTSIVQARASTSALTNLNKLFSAAFVGPIRGRVGSVLQLFGKGSDQELEFRAASAAFENQIVKQITGAQMSEVEATRILRQVPRPNDPPRVWQAKWRQSVQNVQFLRREQDRILKEFKLEAPVGPGNTDKPLFNPQASDDDLLKRLEELSQAGGG
jgi:hypothetical protein